MVQTMICAVFSAWIFAVVNTARSTVSSATTWEVVKAKAWEVPNASTWALVNATI